MPARCSASPRVSPPIPAPMMMTCMLARIPPSRAGEGREGAAVEQASRRPSPHRSPLPALPRTRGRDELFDQRAVALVERPERLLRGDRADDLEVIPSTLG